MLVSSIGRPKCRLNATTLQPLIAKLCFSFSTAQQCISLSDAELIQQEHVIPPETITQVLSNCLSTGRHSDTLSLLRLIPFSRSVVFYWNNLLKRSVSLQDQRNALKLFDEMRRLGWVPDGYTYPYVFKACGDLSSLVIGMSVHALALVSGHTDSNVFVDNAAVAMYGRCGAYDKAQQLFDEMLERGVFDTISWNSIISVYVQAGDCRRALRMFEEMVSRGDILLRADAVSLVNILPACASLKSWRRGMEIHGYAIRRGLLEDVVLGNAIIDMYAKCNLMDEASNLFDRMEVKDVVSWNAMVSGYSQIGKFDDALGLFERMRKKDIELNVVTWSALIAGYAQKGRGYEALDVFRKMIVSGSQPNAVTLVSVLSGCATSGALVHGKEAHCYVIKKLLDLEGDDPGDEMMVINGLIDMYIKCKNLKIAHAMFDCTEIKNRSVVTWTVMIGGYAQHGEASSALELFAGMRRLGWVPIGYTYPYVFKACGDLSSLVIGMSVHALALVSGHTDSNVFVDNAAVSMYGRCGAYDKAQQLFDEMLERGVFDTISWNSIIYVYVQAGDCRMALQTFEDMVSRGDILLQADAGSLVHIISACAFLKSWRRGMEIHGYAIRRCLLEDVFVGNAIIDMYAKCNLMDEANNLFDRMEVKDVVSWNTMVSGYFRIAKFDDALGLLERMREKDIELDVVTWSAVIAGYAQRGRGYEALDVFREMIVSGSQPSAVTLVSVLSGCATYGALLHGKETHCYVIKQLLDLEGNDLRDEMMVINGIINMYAKCENLKIAHAMFNCIEMKNRSVVTWTTMIGGFAQHGEANSALELFSGLLRDKYRMMPDGVTISCALAACARVGAIRLGREIHAHALRNRYEEAMLFISNCLIDMYAKSGEVDAARAVFDNMVKKNAVSWTSIMKGYGLHGRGEEALQMFEGMWRSGLPVDGFTFLVVLNSCSHSGMVDQGIGYFNNMKKDFGVVPGVEHYACMVDLLGRADRLNIAMKLIKDMPMEPNPIIWVALLGGCRLHRNVELAEHAVNQLLELKYENDGLYTLLSSVYASVGRWKNAAKIRLLVKHSGIKKRPGCSWVQGNNGTTVFFAGDESHPMAEQIYNLLDDLTCRIKMIGYTPEASFSLHDVD